VVPYLRGVVEDRSMVGLVGGGDDDLLQRTARAPRSACSSDRWKAASSYVDRSHAPMFDTCCDT
jgi:hypothetical protein